MSAQQSGTTSPTARRPTSSASSQRSSAASPGGSTSTTAAAPLTPFTLPDAFLQHCIDRFAELDTAKTGILDGKTASAFLTKSNLPGQVLMQIWQLADAHHRGALNQREFNVAMDLCRKVVSGELAVPLPDVLEENILYYMLEPELWQVSDEQRERYLTAFASLEPSPPLNRISGQKASTFLQGSGLSRAILRRIWYHYGCQIDSDTAANSDQLGHSVISTRRDHFQRVNLLWRCILFISSAHTAKVGCLLVYQRRWWSSPK